MKKIILSVLAICTLVACNNEETLQQPSPTAIAFGEAFVYKTRATADPSISTNGENGTKAIDAFKVWAYMENPGGVILNGNVVSRGEDNTWTYEKEQYWWPNHTYYFGAVAPVANANWTLDTSVANEYGAGKLSFTNVDGSEDLLYSATTVSTVGMTLGDEMPPVKLFFSHLLSKVKFTFANGFETDNVTVKVSNIRMTAPKSATIDLAVPNWWDNKEDWTPDSDTIQLAFDDLPTLDINAEPASTNARLTIPTVKGHTYTITFDIDLYVGNVHAYKVEKTSVVNNVAFEMGKSYNFTAAINPENLNLDQIEFEVVVKGWEIADDTDIE